MPTSQRKHGPFASGLAVILLLVAAFSLATGYSYPAISFNMEARGYSATLIGIQAACAGLGIVASALSMPFLMQRLGIWWLALIGVYGTAVSILAFGLTERLVPWLFLRFLLGMMINVLFVVSETWINLLAPEARRGRVIAAYTAVNAGMFAVGPLLVPVIGYSGLSSFGIMGVIVALMGLSLVRLRATAPPLETARPEALLRVVAAIPVLLFTVVAFGFFDGSILALWVVYGLDHGLNEQFAILTLWAIMMGNVLLQFPIGWLADRFSRRHLLALLAAIGFCGAALLPIIPLYSWFALFYLVVWGGAAFGVYTLALTLVGQHLRGIQLVAATAAFGLAWGVGTLVGPWSAGGLMEVFSSAMLPATIALVYGLLILAAVFAQPIRRSLMTFPQS